MIPFQMDFYAEFVREGDQLYDDIRIFKRKDEFNEWVRVNFIPFININGSLSNQVGKVRTSVSCYLYSRFSTNLAIPPCRNT
jgi:hypothetical protein